MLATSFDQAATERQIIHALQKGTGRARILPATDKVVQFSKEFWERLEENQIKLPTFLCTAFAAKQANIPDAMYLQRMVKNCGWDVPGVFFANYPFRQ